MIHLLDKAISARAELFDRQHESAFRLFNGFLEGYPTLVVDLYAKTLVIHNYAKPPEDADALLATTQLYLRERLPWIRALVVKKRKGKTDQERRGEVLFGANADGQIREDGVRYAVELLMNRDGSFYLDTRNLRRWALEHLHGKSVLNTFAYTGSLGVAACAAGATRVLHLDLNRRFLNVAKRSYTLNGFPIHKRDFQVADFWSRINHLKRAGERFDCIFLDPPFFSRTKKGKVDLAQNATRLINKVRPLVEHGGYIVAINNALFLSGHAYFEALTSLCVDGYVEIKELIPVPSDFTGYPETRVTAPITDPAPFNHSTKIAVLEIRHKQ
jgi:23S rRNA (cytosine1962-C5)-methyltransferase